MNTIRITKHANGWSCEFHGSGFLIPSEDYFTKDAGRMLREITEWCARTPTSLKAVAETQEPTHIM